MSKPSEIVESKLVENTRVATYKGLRLALAYAYEQTEEGKKEGSTMYSTLNLIPTNINDGLTTLDEIAEFYWQNFPKDQWNLHESIYKGLAQRLSEANSKANGDIRGYSITTIKMTLGFFSQWLFSERIEIHKSVKKDVMNNLEKQEKKGTYTAREIKEGLVHQGGSKKACPPSELILKILNASPLEARAFFITMAKSGGRPASLLGLHYNPENPDNNETEVSKIPSELTFQASKSGFPYFSFLDEEGTMVLKQWLEHRIGLYKGNKVFIHEEDWYRRIWTRGLEAYGTKENGWNEKNKDGNHEYVYRMYTLRTFFSTNLEIVGGMARQLVEFLEGHRSKAVIEAYKSIGSNKIKTIYLESANKGLRIGLFDKPSGQINIPKPDVIPPSIVTMGINETHKYEVDKQLQKLGQS